MTATIVIIKQNFCLVTNALKANQMYALSFLHLQAVIFKY